METNTPCYTCGVVHYAVPRQHALTTTGFRRAIGYSKNWKARKQLEQELLHRRMNRQRP